jgi:RHS repeat-associated protein
VQSDLIRRADVLLAAETSSGLRHFHLDHLGTPRLVTDANGNATAFHVYYPYGEEATAFNQDAIRQKFTGHERDLANPAGAGDDLDSMHARFYNPLVGRFWGVDPVGGQANQPQSWNRFSYVTNRPLTLIDPQGRFPMPLHVPPPTGMTLDDYGYGYAMTVTSSGPWWSTSNPFTGLRGALGLAQGRAQQEAIAKEGSPYPRNSGLSLNDRFLSSINADWAQAIGNSIVGFGDIVSFGVTGWSRTEAGLDHTIQEDSTAYAIGQVAGVAHGVALSGLGVARAVGVQTRVALHGPHHSFGALGRLRHFQLNWWKIGVKRSGGTFRIPLPWRK